MENTTRQFAGEGTVRILALDQSLTNTGVCLLISAGGGAPEMATQTLSPSLRGAQRLAWFYDWALEAMTSVDLVIIEGYAYGAQNSREVMGELGGILRMAAYKAGKPLLVSPPSCVKNFALPTSTRKLQGKEQMMQAARDSYGLALPLKKHEHEADAAHLAALALSFALGEVSLYPRRNAATAQLSLQGESGECHVNMTSAAAGKSVKDRSVADRPVVPLVLRPPGRGPVVKRGVRG